MPAPRWLKSSTGNRGCGTIHLSMYPSRSQSRRRRPLFGNSTIPIVSSGCSKSAKTAEQMLQAVIAQRLRQHRQTGHCRRARRSRQGRTREPNRCDHHDLRTARPHGRRRLPGFPRGTNRFGPARRASPPPRKPLPDKHLGRSSRPVKWPIVPPRPATPGNFPDTSKRNPTSHRPQLRCPTGLSLLPHGRTPGRETRRPGRRCRDSGSGGDRPR